MATYDPTNAPSLSLTPSQLGSSPVANSTWTERTFPFTSSASIAPGFSYDFGVANDSEQGLALAPKRPFTNATNDLAGTGETPEVWTLTLNTTELAPNTFSANLYGVITHTPSAFSTGNDPYTLSTTAGSSFLISIISIITPDNWVLNDSGFYDMVWELDFMEDHTDSVSGATVSSPIAATINDSAWNGLLQLFLIPSTFWSVSITGATFVGRTIDWHTGFIDAKMDVRGRAVHDYKSGQPMMSQEATEDGYLDGIMVHPDNFDPADPLDTDPFTPPPGEGVVDDNLIDLE